MPIPDPFAACHDPFGSWGDPAARAAKQADQAAEHTAVMEQNGYSDEWEPTPKPTLEELVQRVEMVKHGAISPTFYSPTAGTWDVVRHMTRSRGAPQSPRRARCALRSGRPAARRPSQSRSAGGGSDGPSGEPPAHVARFARAFGLSLDGVRWCQWCERVAFAVDPWQRDYLDAEGFVNDLCPDCRKGLVR
jgi:hypothetical protein